MKEIVDMLIRAYESSKDEESKRLMSDVLKMSKALNPSNIVEMEDLYVLSLSLLDFHKLDRNTKTRGPRLQLLCDHFQELNKQKNGGNSSKMSKTLPEPWRLRSEDFFQKQGEEKQG